jgi:hypothetical protein
MIFKLKEITIILSVINNKSFDFDLDKSIKILKHLINIDDENFEITNNDLDLCNNTINKTNQLQYVDSYLILLKIYADKPENHLDLIITFLNPIFVTAQLNKVIRFLSNYQEKLILK